VWERSSATVEPVPREMATSSEEIHLHRGTRAIFPSRNFCDREIFFVEGAQQFLPRGWQFHHCIAQKEILPLPVQIILELWPDTEMLFVDGIDVFQGATLAPVIAARRKRTAA